MIIRVQEEDFDPDVLLAGVGQKADDIGAVASFTGLVRADKTALSHDPVKTLVLEHYPGMTERELTRIAEEAIARFDLKDVIIVHRVGRLDAGARIVFVAAAASHRQAAFDGAGFMMDFLKTEAPFWKREETADGPGRWVDARDSDRTAAERWIHPAAERETSPGLTQTGQPAKRP